VAATVVPPEKRARQYANDTQRREPQAGIAINVQAGKGESGAKVQARPAVYKRERVWPQQEHEETAPNRSRLMFRSMSVETRQVWCVGWWCKQRVVRVQRSQTNRAWSGVAGSNGVNGGAKDRRTGTGATRRRRCVPSVGITVYGAESRYGNGAIPQFNVISSSSSTRQEDSRNATCKGRIPARIPKRACQRVQTNQTIRK
jgi:hypothetical protein